MKKNSTLKYCLPIIKDSQEDVLKTIDLSITEYDYFEVWLDHIEDLNMEFIKKLEKKLDSKLILLFRRQKLETVKMSSAMTKSIIKMLNNSNILVDLDILSQKKELDFIKKNNINMKKIVSYHNYKETPSDGFLKNVLNKMNKHNPYIYKVSAFCNSENDSVRLLNLTKMLKTKNNKYIVLGMGEKGVLTRIAGIILGNEMHFAPKTLAEKSAPGQLTKKQLKTIVGLLP